MKTETRKKPKGKRSRRYKNHVRRKGKKIQTDRKDKRKGEEVLEY